MDTPVDYEVTYRVGTRGPTVPYYRPLVETPSGRMLMPARFTIIVDVGGLDSLERVEFDVELIDRRYRITRFQASPPAGGSLDFAEIQRLDVPSFLRSGLGHLIKLESTDGDTYTSENPITNPDPLWPVAITYSAAQALGEHPTRAVAADLGISHDAAAQRVKRARDAGYLPATTKGRSS